MSTIERITDPDVLRGHLAAYYGTEQWYRHFSGPLYTDGVKFFAYAAGAYWLLDILLTELPPMMVQKREEFVHVSVESAHQKAYIQADDGNGNLLWDRRIESTDLLEGEWEFYFTGGVLMLPSEY